MKAPRLFHLLDRARWRELRAAGAREHRPPSLAAEGFVHLSYRHQLRGTLDAHFRGVGALVLLELDPAVLGQALVVEASRGGEPFPHLYGPLDLGAVRAVWPLEPGPDGFDLPPRL